MDCNNHTLEQIENLIIGGGVSGLSTANRLLELGQSPCLIDAGSYPSHKICGEFFSNECHEILNKWGVLPPAVIDSIRFHLGEKSYSFKLPKESRGMSRYGFDTILFKRAEDRGTLCFTNSSVTSLSYHPNELYSYHVTIQNGRLFRAKKLFIGTGRLLNLLLGKEPPTMKYRGFKTHFEGIDLDQTLEMFILPKGYLGISPIENGKVNVACLMKKENPFLILSPEQYLDKIDQTPVGKSLRKILKKGKPLFNEWLTTEIPEFRLSPHFLKRFQNLYLIGDAAAAIAPASGDGLAMAVTSGVLAADCSVEKNTKVYHHQWKNIYQNRLRWAAFAHKLMFHPYASLPVLQLASVYPKLFDLLYFKTRGL